MKKRMGGQAARGASKLPYEGARYRMTYIWSPKQHRRNRQLNFIIVGIVMLIIYAKTGSGIVLCTISILPSESKWWSV